MRSLRLSFVSSQLDQAPLGSALLRVAKPSVLRFGPSASHAQMELKVGQRRPQRSGPAWASGRFATFPVCQAMCFHRLSGKTLTAHCRKVVPLPEKNRPAGPAPSLARLEGLRHLWRSALPGACKLASSEPSSCCNIAAQAFAVSSDLEGHRKCSEREIFLKTGLHWLERSAVNSIARMTT